MTSRFLPDVDEVERGLVREAFGTAIATEVAFTSIQLIQDANVTPRAIAAGLIDAHVQRAAVTISKGYLSGHLTAREAAAIVVAASDMLDEALEVSLAASLHADVAGMQ